MNIKNNERTQDDSQQKIQQLKINSMIEYSAKNQASSNPKLDQALNRKQPQSLSNAARFNPFA